MEKMEINSHGAHQLALRRRSVKVFEGAIKVSTMRAPWESGAGSGGGAGDTGRTGAAAISASWNIRGNSNLGGVTQACGSLDECIRRNFREGTC